MEKLIKIKARMIDGTIEKYRTTSFTVKPFRNGDKDGRLCIKLDDGYTFVCKSIEVEQKELEPELTYVGCEETNTRQNQAMCEMCE